MTTPVECVPCLIRRAIETVELSTSDEDWRRAVLGEVLQIVGSDCHKHPPHTLMRQLYSFISNATGQHDPWRHRKHADLTAAMSMLPELRSWIEHARDPFAAAVIVAVAGNGLTIEEDVEMSVVGLSRIMRGTLPMRRSAAMKRLKSDVAEAGSIMYLADTACETVFDRLLIERMPLDRTLYVVKKHPRGRKATMTDAHAAGIPNLVEMINTGSDVPGAAPDECSRIFRERFDNADLIIAKGQNHYAMLRGSCRNIFFLLRAHCDEIARSLGCDVGKLVLRSADPQFDGDGTQTLCPTDAPKFLRAKSQQLQLPQENGEFIS